MHKLKAIAGIEPYFLRKPGGFRVGRLGKPGSSASPTHAPGIFIGDLAQSTVEHQRFLGRCDIEGGDVRGGDISFPAGGGNRACDGGEI